MKPATIRFDKLLANLGYGSRREVTGLAFSGRITMDGAPVHDPDARIALEADLPSRILIDGAPMDPLPGMVIMLHKPLGATCSHKESGTLVYDYLPNRWMHRDPKISSIGRLDKETSGLLLLTDDGALLHKVISPKQHVPKRYHVTLARALSGEEAGIFASGTLMLESEETPLLPVEMHVLGTTTARVTLHEGRYHQVRRMFAAVGNHVEALHRESVGGLSLPDDLPAGSYHLLTPEQVQAIFTN